MIFRDTSQKHCMEQWNGSSGLLTARNLLAMEGGGGVGREGVTPVEKGVRCYSNTSVCSPLLLPVPENWWVSSIIGF